MSGTGQKPKSQAAPPQKGKVTTTRQTRPIDTEVQERGKTRATGAVETDEDEHEIGDSEKGRSFLEGRLLMVPAGALLTLGALATTLFQIAAMPGVALPAVNAVRAVAFLLRDVELEVVAEDIRDIANAQLNELTNDLKTFTEVLTEKVMEELEKKTEGSSLSNCANLALVGKFAEAMGRATGQQHKIRSALKLQNGGILVEMVTDDGVAWLASKANAEAFLQELGETEASFKTRSFNVVAYYVPLNLDANSEKDRGEIEEMNNIPKGALTKLRWIKPPARRRPDQRFAHVIATFSDAESANRAIVNGLSICHKRVSVAKCKKEPIRCLKCQGWDHIALECIIAKEVNVCGTCGGDHWTNELNARDPANDLPFFPAKESWTWAPSYPSYGRRVPQAEIHVNTVQPGSQKDRYRQTQLGFEPAAPSGRPYTRDSRARQQSKTPADKSPPPVFPNPESPIAPPASSNGSPPPDSSTTQVIAHV
ncbi:uncharacterized protein LACBIDRAFT_331988 [Laccaria bicolor S238N-H82]|uniref:Predicted protein n=1 Tax=Laccaria bicolor (strain S238N-H82 / ATCC MYA-4686) TaxID=486041 RepID=B0DQX8_LACBS|nr:uncharacterized protein LACBIDRAFT_331988 [Laccaria bicolor S238N-H82]EDR03021.1 predicted protein [Laccaria bicolor S238N-H82]|eukprot:XP_001886444.1 predicted protein [Laccaria bicolor S238N-H82]